MSTPTPTPEPPKRGTTVYDLYGNVGQVNMPLPDGSILVGIMFDGIDYDSRGEERTVEFEGPLQVWHKWFLKPPVQKKAEEVAALDKEVDELRNKIRSLRSEEVQAIRTAGDRMRFLQQHEKLQRLDDFLSGKIAYIVIESWNGPCMLSTEGWDRYRREHNRIEGVKLLTLYGEATGELNWRLGEYADGSGSSTIAHPCLSKEEAVAKVQQLCEVAFARYLEKGDNSYAVEKAIALLSSLNLTVPEAVLEKGKAIKTANLKTQIEHKKRELQGLEAQLTNPQPEVEG